MPPPDIATLCQPMAPNATAAPDKSDLEDRNALLYIVVTLLFYSMGIVIGIITYLKREQAEMEEDKMFEVYLHMKREPFNLHRQERVNQMALYLKQLEDRKVEMEKAHRWKGSGSEQQLHHPLCPHQQLQLQREQHSDSQLYPDARKHSTHVPCSVCHVGSYPSDHSDPHHLQPLISRSRHGSGKETPAGTPALLCSLTLNVCEPFLSPETLPKAAVPFRTPTSKEGGQSLCLFNTQAVPKTGGSPGGNDFVNDISVLKTLPSNSDTVQAMYQMPKNEPSSQLFCSPEGLYGHLNNSSGNHTDFTHGETVVELQQLGYDSHTNNETNNDVFQNSRVQLSQADEKLDKSQHNERNNDDLYSSHPLYKPLELHPSHTSPQLHSKSLSMDQVPSSSGRNKLKRQLSLHNDRSLHSAHKPSHLLPKHTQDIEEEDSEIARFSGSDGSPVCTAEEIDENSAENETPNCSMDGDSTDQVTSEECSDQLPNSPPLKPHERAPLGAISVSHSDPLLPEKHLPSPKSTTDSKPRDARPKIFSLFTKSDNTDKEKIQSINPVAASLEQGEGKLRQTILQAWRENSPQSVDVPELTRPNKAVSPNTSFPPLLKGKSHHSQQPEATRSTFPRAPGSREERRGALFLSQKSLLHSSGTSPRSGLGSGPRSGLHYQASVDCTTRTSPDQMMGPSLKPLLDSDHLQLSERDITSEDGSGLAPLMSTQRDPRTRIPKLSRARTVDNSTLFQK